MSSAQPVVPASTQGSEVVRALRNEARELLTRLGFRGAGRDRSLRAILIPLALIVLFGFWLPIMKGSDFLDAVILGSYACLGVIFAAPVAAVRFGGDRTPAFASLLARILVSVAYGLAMSIPMLMIGVIAVYSTRTVFVGPDVVSVATCFLLGLSLSFAVTAIVTWTTLRFSASAGKGVARATFMSLLLAFFEWSRWLPDVALTGAAVASIVAAGMLLLLYRQAARDPPAL